MQQFPSSPSQGSSRVTVQRRVSGSWRWHCPAPRFPELPTDFEFSGDNSRIQTAPWLRWGTAWHASLQEIPDSGSAASLCFLPLRAPAAGCTSCSPVQRVGRSLHPPGRGTSSPSWPDPPEGFALTQPDPPRQSSRGETPPPPRSPRHPAPLPAAPCPAGASEGGLESVSHLLSPTPGCRRDTTAAAPPPQDAPRRPWGSPEPGAAQAEAGAGEESAPLCLRRGRGRLETLGGWGRAAGWRLWGAGGGGQSSLPLLCRPGSQHPAPRAGNFP